MLVTVVVVVMTHDLSKGVLAGVLLRTLFFARKVSRLLTVSSTRHDAEKHRIYTVTGQVFFASADQFASSIVTKEDLDTITIDLHLAQFWDLTAVDALDRVKERCKRAGIALKLIGLNEASATIVTRLGRTPSP